MFSIKDQEVRAGGFTLRFGSHSDDSNTCYVQVTGATEGQQITFQRDGEALAIAPIMPVVDAPAPVEAPEPPVPAIDSGE